MDIESLTIGQVRSITQMLAPVPCTRPSHIFDEFVGKYCVCRASAAGVHAGYVKAIQANGDGTKSVVLTDARRLWKWKANQGVSLSGVATAGVSRAESKIEAKIPIHAVDGVCEIIGCTENAKESINGA